MDFITLVSDPFVGVGIMAVAWILIWWTRRDKSSTKFKYLRTEAECRAHGVDPAFAGYWRIPVDQLAKKSKAQRPTLVSSIHAVPMAKSDVGLLAPPMLINLSDIADDPAPINIMIIGNKGAGKTTLLRTLVHRRSDILDEIIAVDPLSLIHI